jgi:hypothetical protein
MRRRRNWFVIGILSILGLLLTASVVVPWLNRMRDETQRQRAASQLH